MVDVSAEWILNQNSINRKQGYVIITITLPAPANPVVISTLDSQSIDPNKNGRTLKSLKHKRSYDPMGLSLPTNNIAFDLYNFDGRWTYLYDNYEYTHLPITVQYGYCLSENETISGGVFTSDLIDKKGDVVTVTAKSSLEIKNSDVIRKALDMSQDEVMFSLWGEYRSVTAEDLGRQETSQKFSVVKTLLEDAGFGVISNSGMDDIDIYIIDNQDYTVSMAVQYSANAALQRCEIDRNDNIVFRNSAPAPSREIKTLNMRAKPTYERSKALKNIVCKTKVQSTEELSTTSINMRSGEGRQSAEEHGFPSKENLIYYRDYNIDWTEFVITRISGNVVEVKRGLVELPQYEYMYGTQSVVGSGKYVPGIKVWCYREALPTVYFRKKANDTTIESGVYNENGITCDINNPYGAPSDFDKIAAYFSNRDIYTLDLRGDPSIDVGDYVMVSLNDDNDYTTYKKALVLESELTFDGSFKDQMKVRIIDTDFETITGNTHEELSEYKHSQLAEYTHKQLMTEAI